MLFLRLGTGLGSALVVDDVVEHPDWRGWNELPL